MKYTYRINPKVVCTLFTIITVQGLQASEACEQGSAVDHWIATTRYLLDIRHFRLYAGTTRSVGGFKCSPHSRGGTGSEKMDIQRLGKQQALV
jgi:hypothetical protein